MKRIALRIVATCAGLLLALFLIMTMRTLTMRSMQIAVAPRPLPEVHIDRAAESLREAIRLETISHEDIANVEVEAFLALHRVFEARYPLVHQHLQKELVSDLSLLYTWPGSDPEAKGMIVMAHQDVVAAPDPESWTHPPFSGDVADGYIWGRGAMDDKGSLVGLFEAVETLLERGFQPRRTVYLCSGHDEEVGGWNGAAAIAATLAERGVVVEFLLDEGMAVVDGGALGMDGEIAFLSLTEKGYLSLELIARGNPGHASTPPRETTLGMLAKAVARLEDNPMPADLPEPIRLMFRYLAPEMSFSMRLVFANLWLTKPLVLRQLAAERITDAAIRTTTALTIMEGGTKDNVLPPTGRAIVNFRPKPGDTIDMVTQRVRATIADERIELRPSRPPNEAPPMARVDVPVFEQLHTVVRQVFPDALVAPTMMLGGSDSHHYATVAENRYGFVPMRFSEEDLERIHGPNERISIEDFERLIAFYIMLIEDIAS